MQTEQRGLITSIQRYSVHDGPGIRTSVFFKGCNMRCAWCHNPETISREIEELYDPEKCIHCGSCAQGCYAGARQVVGQWMHPDEVMKQVLADRGYYAETGGLTLTGGEPTLQAVFVQTLFGMARQEGVHCAMESNLLTKPETLEAVLPMLDLLMCDLKIWDSDLHQKWTGVPNEQIKANMLLAGCYGLPMLVRIPLVAGINDDEANIRQTASFVSGLPRLECLELLPYHPLGLSKRLTSGVEQQTFEKPSPSAMEHLAHVAGSYHIQVRIAGRPAQ